MLIIIIIIFLIAIISMLGMVMFRAWEIETSRIPKHSNRNIFPKIYFRHVEKIMLYLTKHIVQWIVLVAVKYWFIVYTKTKKWTRKNLPKIFKFLKKESKEVKKQSDSFVKKAILESKTKIKRIKEKVRKEHEE